MFSSSFIVHVPKEEFIPQLFKILCLGGYKWRDESKLNPLYSHWKYYKDNTCYLCDTTSAGTKLVSFCYKEFYEKSFTHNHIPIIDVETFIKNYKEKMKTYTVETNFVIKGFFHASKPLKDRLRAKFPDVFNKLLIRGQHVWRDSKEYMVCHVGKGNFALINIENGNIWTYPVSTDSKRFISIIDLVGKKELSRWRLSPGQPHFKEDPETLEVDEDFIRLAHKEASYEWRCKIEEKFPEIYNFTTVVKVGDKFQHINMGSTFIVARIDKHTYTLLDIETGMMYSRKIELLEGQLTLELLTGGNQCFFKKIN